MKNLVKWNEALRDGLHLKDQHATDTDKLPRIIAVHASTPILQPHKNADKQVLHTVPQQAQITRQQQREIKPTPEIHTQGFAAADESAVMQLLREIQQQQVEMQAALKQQFQQLQAGFLATLKQKNQQQKADMQAILQQQSQEHQVDMQQQSQQYQADILAALRQQKQQHQADVMSALQEQNQQHQADMQAALQQQSQQHQADLQIDLQQQVQQQKYIQDTALERRELELLRAARVQDGERYRDLMARLDKMTAILSALREDASGSLE